MVAFPLATGGTFLKQWPYTPQFIWNRWLSSPDGGTDRFFQLKKEILAGTSSARKGKERQPKGKTAFIEAKRGCLAVGK